MFNIVELDFSCNVTSDWITRRSKMIVVADNYVTLIDAILFLACRVSDSHSAVITKF